MTDRSIKSSPQSSTKPSAKSIVATVLQVQTTAREVLSALAARGIAAAPIKGALVQSWLYPKDPLQRPMKDIDILVDDYPHAKQVLLGLGFTKRYEHSSAATFVRTGCPYAVDLHKQLFRPWLFRMPTPGVFERSLDGTQLLSVPCRRLATIDIYCHTIGHAAISRLGKTICYPAQDCLRMSEKAGITPDQCAQALHTYSMRRAGSYAFDMFRQHRPLGFENEIRQHLGKRMGDRLLFTVATAADKKPKLAWTSRFLLMDKSLQIPLRLAQFSYHMAVVEAPQRKKTK